MKIDEPPQVYVDEQIVSVPIKEENAMDIDAPLLNVPIQVEYSVDASTRDTISQMERELHEIRRNLGNLFELLFICL